MTPASEPKSTKAALKHARQLHLANPLMKGLDVAGAQRLLLENPYGSFPCGTADGEYGPATAAATKAAKFALGYPPAQVNGVFGPQLRAYLSNAPPPTAGFQHPGNARQHV